MNWLRGRGVPRLLRDFAAVRVVFWALLIVPALHYGWANSVAFVTVLSLLALVLSDLAVWSGHRAEIQAEDVSVSADTAAAGDPAERRGVLPAVVPDRGDRGEGGPDAGAG